MKSDETINNTEHLCSVSLYMYKFGLKRPPTLSGLQFKLNEKWNTANKNLMMGHENLIALITPTRYGMIIWE